MVNRPYLNLQTNQTGRHHNSCLLGEEGLDLLGSSKGPSRYSRLAVVRSQASQCGVLVASLTLLQRFNPLNQL